MQNDYSSHQALIAAQTRITTKYNIPNLDSPRYNVEKKRKREPETEHKDAAATPRVPRGTLTLKAFDPESGVALKFKTDKSADVGRMIAGLGRAGRYMAALPVKAEGVLQQNPSVQDEKAAYTPTALEVPTEDAPSGAGTPAVEKNDAIKDAAPVASNDTKPATASKKKKKGKK